MLRNLFRARSSQSNQKAESAPHAGKCIDKSLLGQVAGGAPKGGWPNSILELAARAPKGGWY